MPECVTIGRWRESPGRTERAGAARYGIAGAGLVSGIDNLNEVLHGRKGVGQALTDTAVNTGVGGLSAVSSEALARRLGSGAASTGTGLRNGFAAAKPGFKAGAVVDAVTSGLFSTWDNAAAYRSGRKTGGQATANVLVDTGVGASSGLAGAAAGAAIGSVISMAGFNQPLSKAWNGVSHVPGAISDAPGRLWSGTKYFASGASHAASDTAGKAWSGAKSLAGNTGHAIGSTASKAWGALKSLW